MLSCDLATAIAGLEVNLSRWPFGGRDTCESCKSIDVRRWHREGRLRDGQQFTWSWTSGLIRGARTAIGLTIGIPIEIVARGGNPLGYPFPMADYLASEEFQ
jgi:hypothetical protein